MADFMDQEALESENEATSDEERQEVETGGRSATPTKRKKAVISSDEDEDDEDDDEEKAKEEMKGFIADESDEDGSGSGSGSGSDQSSSGRKKKRKRRRRSRSRSRSDEDLDDDDMELLQENLGIKVKKQRKRIKMDSGSEDEDGDGGMDDLPDIDQPTHAGDGDGYESEDVDDFIVGADGQPIKKDRKKKKKHIFSDSARQNAEDVFGVKFDYDEFSKYSDGEDYESDEDEADEDEDEDDEESRAKRKKSQKKRKTQTIFELMDPSELEAKFYTDKDNEIRNTDIPERMQLRLTPVTSVPEGSDELEREAEWIFKHGFVEAPVSRQLQSQDASRWRTRQDGVREQIKWTLEFIRQESFEVPFIANYRKEYVPDLKINDLWRVYQHDELWCKLQERKRNLRALYAKMQAYQGDTILANPEAPLAEDAKLITDMDVARINEIDSFEELKDHDHYFKLYFGQDIEAMQAHARKKKREERESRKLQKKLKKKKTKTIVNEEGEEVEVTDEEAEEEDEPEEEEDDDEEPEVDEQVLKQAKRKDIYSLCKKYHLGAMAQKFGLSAEKFAENLETNYQRHDVEQDPSDPIEVAKAFADTNEKFKDAGDVLKGAKFMLATQIARDPIVRRVARQAFFDFATISITPTKKGIKEIDESHECYGIKYVRDKPVRDLKDDQWLKITQAEEQKLVTITLGKEIRISSSKTFLDDAKQLFRFDEYSKSVTEWNNLREEIVEMALHNMLYPMFRQELRLKLTREAKEGVIRACRNQLHDWIKVAKYTVTFEDEDEDDWDSSQGCRILAISYENDQDVSSYAVLLTPEGEVGHYLKLDHLLKRKNSFNAREASEKRSDLDKLKDFILDKKPHCVVIGVADRAALDIQRDVMEVVVNLADSKNDFPKIDVLLMDDNLAKVYANSQRCEQDFRDYPSVLRQAVSIARRLQDPLIEFAQLCGAENEILCLRYHPLQHLMPEEELLEGLQIEFINRVNEVGVDINECVAHSHMSNLVQFIGGLGPRKATALISSLRQMQPSQRLENRQQLVTLCHMGPKVLINCAGFIKIDTSSLGDSDVYVEVLDGSRIHNEAYEWARKMAVDALEYDEEDGNPATALDEILHEPEKLAELDLDAFAQELERQGFGKKSITLQDIREELHHMYKDKRAPYAPPSSEEVFNMVTKETPTTFYVGKLLMCVVTGFSYKQPDREELNQAAPIRKDPNQNLWQCPFCGQSDFLELTEVWNHFDAEACPGKATGVKVRLDNGVSGFIPMKNLSDSNVLNPMERVKKDQHIYCRITKINPERFSVECICKSSALEDKEREWKPARDEYYDSDAERRDTEEESKKKEQKQRTTYTKRVIHHQNFFNIGFKQAEKLMESMDQGEPIIRPSSKGDDRLTVTWKVTDGIYQHIDIREEGKINSFTRGKSLWIGQEEFEDLDEIIARHIAPMASNAREVLGFKYYRDTNGGNREKAKELLLAEKAAQPNKIHYILSASKEFPGKFMLSYMPRTHVRHEFVTVTPEGFRYRRQQFETFNAFLKWFKEHFREAIPGTPGTPGGRMTSRTPFTPGGGITPGAMSLATGTPYGATPGGYGGNAPYTPTANTPFMTPYNTPGGPVTPRAGQMAIPPYRGSATPRGGVTPGRQAPPPLPQGMPPPRSGGYTPGRSTPGARGANKMAPYPSPSGYVRQSPAGTPGSTRGGSRDAESWQEAADAWARGGRKTPSNATPRGYTGSTTPRFDENNPKRTPRDNMDPRRTPKHGDGKRTPRALGDNTPLYDEH